VPVEHLTLHRPEEGLHDTVVEAVPFPRRWLTNPPLPQFLGVPMLLALPAMVGMEDEANEIRGRLPDFAPAGAGVSRLDNAFETHLFHEVLHLLSVDLETIGHKLGQNAQDVVSSLLYAPANIDAINSGALCSSYQSSVWPFRRK